MGNERAKLTDQLRAAIQAADKSMGQIARESGIDIATISRFLHGKGGLSMDGLDSLAYFLQVRLTTEKESGKKKDR